MKFSRSITGSICASALVALAACGSTGANQSDPRQFSSDAPGDEPLPGVVRIVGIDRSTLNEDGTVRYQLANISPEDQENLAARVVFYYPPSQQGGIALPYDTDVTDERSVAIYRGESSLEIEAVSTSFAERVKAGEQVLATRIDVQKQELVALTAREGATPGTRVFNDRLECTGISAEDLRMGMDGAPPQLWIEFENVGSEALTGIDVKVLFLDTQGGAVALETGWNDLPDLAPRERGRANVALDGLGSVRNRPFLVRVRQSSRLFDIP